MKYLILRRRNTWRTEAVIMFRFSILQHYTAAGLYFEMWSRVGMY